MSERLAEVCPGKTNFIANAGKGGDTIVNMDAESHLARIARLAKGSGIRLAIGAVTPVNAGLAGQSHTGARLVPAGITPPQSDCPAPRERG